MKYAIEVRNLRKEFTSQRISPGIWNRVKSIFHPPKSTINAVNSISLGIQEGELVGFIGPNGAGKSTTLKMLCGILWPTSGSVTVLGYNPQKERISLSYHLGTVFGQRQQLWLHLPPVDSFELFKEIYGVPDDVYKARLAELASIFEIESYISIPVRKLSLGERMRCEFVASLLHKPRVLFLDEPTIGLDIIAKKKLREYIRKINAVDNTTILLTSHDLEDIETLCKRVIVINNGKIVFDGKMDALRNKIKHKLVTMHFANPVTKIPTIKHTHILHQEPFKVSLSIDKKNIKIQDVLQTYLKHFDIADITIEDPPIEEVIASFYEQIP